jgi:hypothetical protein
MNMISFARVLTMSALLAASAFAADVTGKWTGKVETPNGSRDVTYTLKQDGETLTGSVPGRQGAEVPISEGTVKGDDISFVVTRGERKINYTGKVSGSELKLKYQMQGQDRELTLKKE